MAVYYMVPCRKCRGKMLVDQFNCKARGCDCGFVPIEVRGEWRVGRIVGKLIDDIVNGITRRKYGEQGRQVAHPRRG